MKKMVTSALALMIAVACSTSVLAADIKAVESTPAKPASKVKRLDVNSATEEQLKALPGLNEEYAKKIIAGRPYHKKEELKAKEVVPADVYGKISKLIKALC